MQTSNLTADIVCSNRAEYPEADLRSPPSSGSPTSRLCDRDLQLNLCEPPLPL